MSNAILRIGRLDLPSIGQGDFAYIITTLGGSNFHTAGSAPPPASHPCDAPLLNLEVYSRLLQQILWLLQAYVSPREE